MGEVYRARDTKLKREVAIKVLPEAFSRDPDRVRRFQREAEVLASLNHANIASIYDLQEADSTRYLVLELVEGETLADRILRGAIPVDEALQIGKSICEAVESAHEKGVVHRDLKPANIKRTPDGQVKVLDFGLAKVFLDSAEADLANSPTLMSASIPGAILGTAAYMSPEQAKGRDAERASDVWAFGCVLYEMLTGRPAFEGESIGEILAGVFKTEPAWDRLPAETPPAIRRLLRRCLQKDRTRRLKSLDGARIEIEDALSAAGSAEEPAAPRASNAGTKRILGYVLASLVMLAAGLWIGRLYRPELQSAPVVRFTLSLPEGQTSTATTAAFGALSDDGRYFVMVVSGSEGNRLWLQKLDSTAARLLPGTVGAARPFWSPDSESIGFFADGKLKRIDIDGGPPRTLGDAQDTRGGSWSADGAAIIFAASAGTGISKVSALGGEPVPATTLNRATQEAAHRTPAFLPDGKHFTYVVTAGKQEDAGVFIGNLDDPGMRLRILPVQSQAVYLASGHLMYASDGALYARPFDLKTFSFTGEPALVEEDVLTGPFRTAFSASQTGVVAVQSGKDVAVSQSRRLAWYERSSMKLEPISDPEPYVSIALSPDGKTVAVERRDPQTSTDDVWLTEILRGVSTRFTSHPLWEQVPVWSPDGNGIVFFSNREGSGSLFKKSVRGAGEETLLPVAGERPWPTGWSADGKYVMYESREQSQWDLLAAAVGGSEAVRFLTSRFNERQGAFSPDGQWVAFASDESGQYEIYIQSFPRAGSKVQISLKGGTDPAWRQDGKELYFLQERKLTAVSIAATGDRIDVGKPYRLADSVTFPATLFQPNGYRQYAVASNGQRFLILLPPAGQPSAPITMILNWTTALRKN